MNSVTTIAQDITTLYKNPEIPTGERVEDLLARMTLEEKIGQMTQLNISLINKTGVQRNVQLDEEKARRYLKQHHIGSFLNGEAVPALDWFEYMHELQKIAVEETRLGIPIIYGIDHMHGASYLKGSTIFPHNINLAATFNTDHAFHTGRITAIESADLGHRWNFAPVLDLGRNPSWPRHYETYGESHYVASKMGRAFVDGYIHSEEISPYKVAATGKHFLGYSVPESGWDRTPVHLSDQNIYEFHVPAFKAAIDAGMQTIMVNSGEINGIPVHASKKYLTDLLRNELGFDGVIVTDWNDIGKLVNYHHTAKDYTHATEMAVNAGIDISMTPSSLKFNDSMMELVEAGKITKERIDESVRRILKLKFDLGLFEHPYPRKDRLDRIGSPENKEKAREAANESIVLLKNDESILPLSKDTKNILVIGPSANKKADLAGGWTLSWQGTSEDRYPKDMHTVYTALEAKFPNSNVTLLPFDVPKNELLKEAKKQNVIIAAIGEKPYTEFVGNITSLKLPEDQISLVKTAASTKVPVIGVYIGGRPRIVADIIDSMHAYLWAGLPGFEGADAIADIISGDYNPNGKLSFSYPAYTGFFVPYNHKTSDVYIFNSEEANFIAQDEHNVWEWPFGHGLSYTEFTYSDLYISKREITDTDTITATITVTNTGDRAGSEAIIWYLKDHVGTITRPVKEVKHFEKISLKPGESKVVSFDINPCEDLGFPDFYGNYILETGNFSVLVENQKADFKLVENHSSCSKN
ncbi:MAG: glycoside hydrolase family 3 N-terminal domain-containing protein [Gracilimonas sp.]